MDTTGSTAASSRGHCEPFSLWLDCDTGHDDAFAILVAALHPALNLLGISTVHGNASLENTTYNTRAVLEAIGHRDIPVYPGLAKPFCRSPAPAAAIHGKSGLDGTELLPEPMAPAIDTPNAVEAMYIALKSCPPGTPWLVATGALTNIAVLFLLHPDLTLHIAGLSIMGGVIGGGFTDAKLGTTTYGSESFGNWTPYAEFNIFCDPEAAQSIFSNATLAAKTTLIPLDITHLALATSSVRSKLLYSTPNGTTSTPSRIRRMFHDLLIFFARTYCDVFGLTEGPPLHDPLAIVVIFASELFTIGDEGGERFSVDVVREDLAQTSRGNPKAVSQCGRTVARKAAKGEAGITIPRGLKVEAFWDIVGQCLVRAEKG